MAFGLLSGKYLRNPQARGRVTEFDGFAQRYNKPGVPEAVAAYAALAEAHGLSPGAAGAEVCLFALVCRQHHHRRHLAGPAGRKPQRLGCAVERALEQAVADIRLRWFNPAP